VDEPRKKRPLADDFGFISSLSDLDRGLTDAGADDSPDDGTNNPSADPVGSAAASCAALPRTRPADDNCPASSAI
jgi:hypothetical protein